MSNILLDYNFAKINILIIGDIMLDRYYYCYHNLSVALNWCELKCCFYMEKFYK